MPSTHPQPRPAAPTRFPELNDILSDLVRRVSKILGDDLVGAYLQGSFAVGDADIHSDCDFLFVTAQPVTSEQEWALRELHDEIPTRPGHWVKHLEGSYAPAAELRSLAGLGRPWLYIDHGWRQMQWSTHCNTEVVRWSLRERGVTLAGPPPASLVEPVAPQALRDRMREYAQGFLPDLFTWTNFQIAWSQRYAVATLCRILYTLHTGQVASKRASMLWAIDHLDPAWNALIRQSLSDRDLGFDPDQPPRSGAVDATLSFAEYAKRLAATSSAEGIDPGALQHTGGGLPE